MRPEHVTRALREIGPAWQRDIRAAGDRTKALYAPLLAAAPKEGVTVTRDVSYGEGPRRVLDIYAPEGAAGAAAPVVAFVHGGAFVRGAKDISPDMYGNVLTWFARQGCIGVNVEYRLGDEAPWPGGGQDVADACAWIAANIAAHGGDPRRVCLIGHSAGGTHAATYAWDPALGAFDKDIAALVLVSARLKADVLPENPNAGGVRAYFGPDEALYEQRSPLGHARHSKLPVFIVNAQYENPLLDLYGLELALEIGKARRVAPLHVTMADHNHVSLMAHFNTGEDWLGQQILQFMQGQFER